MPRAPRVAGGLVSVSVLPSWGEVALPSCAAWHDSEPPIWDSGTATSHQLHPSATPHPALAGHYVHVSQTLGCTPTGSLRERQQWPNVQGSTVSLRGEVACPRLQ